MVPALIQNTLRNVYIQAVQCNTVYIQYLQDLSSSIRHQFTTNQEDTYEEIIKGQTLKIKQFNGAFC